MGLGDAEQEGDNDRVDLVNVLVRVGDIERRDLVGEVESDDKDTDWVSDGDTDVDDDLDAVGRTDHEPVGDTVGEHV